jgi:hypothetical protein
MLLREFIIGAVSGAAPAGAMPHVAELTLQLTEMERKVAMPGVLREWAVTDPAAAARFITQHPNSIDSEKIGDVIADWAEVDANAARTWLETNERFFADTAIVTAFIKKWLEVDSAAATEYVRAHAGDEAFGDAMSSVMPIVLRDGINGALRFLDSVPAKAQSFVLTELLNAAGEDQAALARLVDWTATLPEEERDIQTAHALTMWAVRDEERALEWIANRPSSERNRVALLFLVEGAPLTQRTASLALSLPSQSDRAEAVHALLESFSDSEEARRAVTELNLPRKETSALLQIAESKQ